MVWGGETRVASNRRRRMKTSERILEFMRQHGYEPTGVPERIYAGVHQRNAGAWSWSCDHTKGFIGSQWSMAEVLAFENPVFGLDHGNQTCINPD